MMLSVALTFPLVLIIISSCDGIHQVEKQDQNHYYYHLVPFLNEDLENADAMETNPTTSSVVILSHFQNVTETLLMVTMKTRNTMATKLDKTACRYQKPRTKNLIFIILLLLIFVIGMCGNCVAMAVIIMSNRLRAIPTNMCVAALALSDVGAIVFIIPIRIHGLFYGRNFCFGIVVCHMFTFADTLFHTASISHLFLIAVERFVAVSSPFVYQRLVSKRAVWACIAATWAYSAVWACFALFDLEHSQHSSKIVERPGRRFCVTHNTIFYNVVFFAVYLIPLFVIGVLYTCILRIALKQARIINSLSVVRHKPEEEDAVIGRIEGKRDTIRKRKSEVKATKTLAVIYGAFTVCWLPLALITITSKWFPRSYKQIRLGEPVIFEVFFVTFVDVLPALNSCLNPFIYIILNRKFRFEVKLLYHKYQRQNMSPVTLATSTGATLKPDEGTRNGCYTPSSTTVHLSPIVSQYHKNGTFSGRRSANGTEIVSSSGATLVFSNGAPGIPFTENRSINGKRELTSPDGTILKSSNETTEVTFTGAPLKSTNETAGIACIQTTLLDRQVTSSTQNLTSENHETSMNGNNDNNRNNHNSCPVITIDRCSSVDNNVNGDLSMKNAFLLKPFR